MRLEAFSVLTCLGNLLTSKKKRKDKYHTQERMDEGRSSDENGHHGSYNFRQTKVKDFSRRKTSFQGPMFIQYIDIFVPFFTHKTLNSVITYFRFSNSSALVDEVILCNDIL